MRVPTRRGEEQALRKNDPFITTDKYLELKKKLENLKKSHPVAAEEVKRLAELGDFSENAEYQLAKGKLRGINQRMLEIEYVLNHSQIILPNENFATVQLGHTVTLLSDGKERKFKILGSSETNPSFGVISQHSPLGLAILGKKVGDIVKIELANKRIMEYKILKIE
ncbi:MAG: GreA/GreB family elongation factor [Patescibacteria group bacterium]